MGEGVGPLQDAYQALSPTLRGEMTSDEFLAGYRGLAHLSLLQSHLVASSPDSAQVFVEEERTLAMEGLPVMAWFVGSVTVTRTAEGWKISDLKGLKPEDIISTLIGGHMAGYFEASEVAMARLRCNGTASLVRPRLNCCLRTRLREWEE